MRQKIESNGGVISGKKIFAPATDEDFESTVNTATVVWDLIESSVDWLYKNTGKPLGQLITEAGSDVAEWTSEIADLIGATVAFLMKDAVKSASIASNSSNLFTGTGVIPIIKFNYT